VFADKPVDFAQASFLRFGIEARTLLSEFAFQLSVNQSVLRRHLGGRFARDLPTDSSRFNHRDGHAQVFQRSCGCDADDAAADDGRVYRNRSVELRKIGDRCGRVPI
jgi:hypothetical protein